jgi:hypothetical protein
VKKSAGQVDEGLFERNVMMETGMMMMVVQQSVKSKMNGNARGVLKDLQTYALEHIFYPLPMAVIEDQIVVTIRFTGAVQAFDAKSLNISVKGDWVNHQPYVLYNFMPGLSEINATLQCQTTQYIEEINFELTNSCAVRSIQGVFVEGFGE